MLPQLLCSIGVGVTCAAVAYIVHQRRSPKVHARLKCHCGQVQGSIDTVVANLDPIVCYCSTCQRYAAWVASTNTTKSCVNESGGTPLVQMPKNTITITRGHDKTVVSKLSPNTGLLRMYTSCCGTAMFNASKSFPFVGVVNDFIDEIEKIDDAAGPALYMFVDKATAPIAPHEGSEMTGLTLSWLVRIFFNIFRYWPARKVFPLNLDVEPLLIPK